MASVVVEEVISKYVLDSSRYKAGAQDVKNASGSIAKDNQALGGSFSSLVGGFKAAGAGLTAIGAIVAAELAIVKKEVEFVGDAMQKAAAFESLTSSLEAIEGGADRARRSIARLKEIAKAPGLGLQEASTGYLRLRRADMGREEAFRTVAAAGKANALSGGTKENLDRVLLAISQIASKANISQEEILQLTEAGVNAGKALKDAFGTADTEELKRMGVTSQMALAAIVAAFEKLPDKAGGAQNAFDNLSDAIDFATIAIGGAFNEALLGQINDFANAIGELTDRGVFKAAADMVAQNFATITDSLGGTKETIFKITAAFVVFNEHIANVANTVIAIANRLKNLIPFIGQFVDFQPVNLLTGSSPFARFEEVLKMLRLQDEAGQKRSEAQAKKDKEAEARDKAKEGQDTLGGMKGKNPVLDELTKNSKRTADNTEKIANIQDQVLGGGTLGSRGLSRQEISDISTGRTASGTREIKTILVELGVAIERGMSRTAARAIGNNVSRREV
jgi:tape measure domain-containing protein